EDRVQAGCAEVRCNKTPELIEEMVVEKFCAYRPGGRHTAYFAIAAPDHKDDLAGALRDFSLIGNHTVFSPHIFHPGHLRRAGIPPDTYKLHPIHINNRRTDPNIFKKFVLLLLLCHEPHESLPAPCRTL